MKKQASVEITWYGRGLNLVEINTWCSNYCKGSYHHVEHKSTHTQPMFNGKILSIEWFFNDSKDAMLFKLRWS